MLSFFMGVITALQAGGRKLSERREKLKTEREKIKKRVREEQGIPEEVDDQVEAKKQKARTKFLTAMTAVIAFFETLPLFFSLITWGLIILCVLVIVVIIFSFLAALTAFIRGEDDFWANQEFTSNASTVDCSAPLGVLEWTEAELASRGAMLTEYEKNMYRMGILAKETIEGYGGEPYLEVETSLATKVAFQIGVSSIETSMIFFENGASEANRLTMPTHTRADKEPYGFLGISRSTSLDTYANQGYITSKDASAVKAKYNPSSTPSYHAQYAPWGMLMSVGHMESRLKDYIYRQSTADIINKVADEWGIKANKEEFFALSQLMLMQAQYHGAYLSDYEEYITFWAALFVATSDNDEERTYDKWTISEGSYGEYSMRYSFMSGSGFKSIHGNTYRLSLNGEKIEENVWTFLEKKFPNNSKLNQAKSNFLSKAQSQNSQALNYHYGFNSYIMGKHIEKILSQKMNIVGTSQTQMDCGVTTVTPGNFTATPGEGNAFIGGKTVREYMEEYYNKTTESRKKYLKGLEQYWGKSSFLENEDNPARQAGYVDKDHGVPFYGQSSRYSESWGYYPYVPGGNTFYVSACMIYSYAYAASAMTGTLINPAEMGAIIHANGGFSGNLVYTGKLPDIYSQMGLKARDVPNGKSWDGFEETLDQGGVVVIRTIPGPEGFTRSQHFQVLTGKEEKDGTTYYRMYTSSSHTQSMAVYTKEQVLRNMHRNALLVWK